MGERGERGEEERKIVTTCKKGINLPAGLNYSTHGRRRRSGAVCDMFV
jgi:hypothetical protein